MDTIVRILENAFNASSGLIPDGFKTALKSIFPKNDVLIWSDINHRNAATKHADLLSPERLQAYASAGVTDIYLEQLESAQHLVAEVASGAMSSEEFVASYKELGHAKFLSAEDNAKDKTAIAEMIKAAQSLNPPITIHFTQITETEEQKQQLAALKSKESTIYFTYQNTIIPFISTHANKDNKELFEKLYENEISQSFRSGSSTAVDFFSLEEHFEDIVPLKDIDKLTIDLIALKQEQLSLLDQYQELFTQFRIDNDVLLADKIMQTRNPDGKVLVVHGASHGGKRDNDLDELLLQRGLSSTRVNTVYDINDLKRMQESNNYKDISEISYFPDTNALQIIDANNDGRINGSEGVEPPELPDPIQKNSSNLIIKH